MKKMFNITISFDPKKGKKYTKNRTKFRNVNFLGDDGNVELQFENCRFKSCEFGGYLQDSHFKNCKFENCRFYGMMDGTTFEVCWFIGGAFEANIRHGKIKHACFDDVDFGGITGFDLWDVAIESVYTNRCAMPQHSEGSAEAWLAIARTFNRYGSFNASDFMD